MSVKISALPAVPSALLTDIFPVVQAGVTYKETLSQLATLFNANLAFLPLSGGTMSGAIAMGTFKITGMGDPTLAQDAATKFYVDAATAGGPFQPLNANLTDISGLATTLDTIIYGNGTNFVQKTLGVTSRVVYVDIGGSDVTGDGSILFPFATIFKANSVIVGNTAANRWIVSIGAGLFAEASNILLKPFVAYIGRGYEETTITSPNNLVGADPSFSASAAISRVAMAALRLDGTTGITFDLNAVGGVSSCLLELTDVIISGDLNYYGRASGDYFHGWGGLILGNVRLSNTLQGFYSNLITNGTLTIDTANNAGNTVFAVLGGGVVGNISLTSSGGATNVTSISACQNLGTITVNAATTTLSIDAVSLPTLAANLIQTAGPTVNYVTADYGIAASFSPVNYTPTAATVDGNFRGIDAAFGSIGPGPFQPLNTNLTDISAMTPTANTFIYGNSTGTAFVNTVLQFGNQYYIDFQNGNDTTNNGTMAFPWKTLQHAYDSVTPNNTFPTVFNLVPGFDSVDVSPITGKGNVFLNAVGGILNINQDIVIGVDTQTSVVTMNNINLLGTFTWVQNNAFPMYLNLFNTVLNFQTTFQQTGAGQSLTFLYAQNSVLTNTDVTAGQVTLLSSSVYGNFTYNDSGAAFFQAEGGAFGGGTLAFSGGISARFAGVFADSGYAISTATTGSGTPALITDSNSIPLGVTGPGTITFISQADYINANYTPVNYTPTAATVDGNFRGIDTALATFMPFSYTAVAGTSQALVANSGYQANNAGLTTFTLPAVAAFGTVIKIVGYGTGLYTIAQNVGQVIHNGNVDSTVGVGGSVSSTHRYDCIDLLCSVANTEFTVINDKGEFSVV